MMARSPRSSAPASTSQIAVLLPVPVVPMNLKCLVSSAAGIRHSRDQEWRLSPTRCRGGLTPAFTGRPSRVRRSGRFRIGNESATLMRTSTGRMSRNDASADITHSRTYSDAGSELHQPAIARPPAHAGRDERAPCRRRQARSREPP